MPNDRRQVSTVPIVVGVGLVLLAVLNAAIAFGSGTLEVLGWVRLGGSVVLLAAGVILFVFGMLRRRSR